VGGTIEMDRPVTNWPCRPPPPKRRILIFPLISVATNRATAPSHGRFAGQKRLLVVDCGMVDFLDRDRWSNLIRPLQFGQGINPPRRPNFAQNMHPNKRCRRSLTHPNRTKLEYHNVDNCVAVGRTRRFCLITPIAFVGGVGGWCCGAPYSWCD
jgi:hypothetical protein